MVLGLEAQDLQYLAERLQMEYSEFMKFRIAFLDLDKLSGISLIFEGKLFQQFRIVVN